MGFLSDVVSVAAPVVGGIIGGPTGVAVGGAIAGGIIGAKGAENAADTSLEALERSLAFQGEQADIGRADLATTNQQAIDAINAGRDTSTGLISEGGQRFEDLITQGRDEGLFGLALTHGGSRALLDEGSDRARESIKRSRGVADQNFINTRDVLRGIQGRTLDDINATEGRSRGDITSGRDLALGQIDRGITGAEGDLSPFANTGVDANDLRAALTGALGPEAQQAAFDAYIESPGQAFLREQDERAVLRNAAATGGLRGGNVLEELGRRSSGRNALRLDTDINHLGNIANTGLNAATGLAGIRAALRGQGAGIETETGRSLGQISQAAGGRRASARDAFAGRNQANINLRGDRLIGVNEDLADLDVLQTGANVDLTQGFGNRVVDLNNAFTDATANNARDTSLNLAGTEDAAALNTARLLESLGVGSANIATQQGSQGAGLINNQGLIGAGADLAKANAIGGTVNDVGTIFGNFLANRPKKETTPVNPFVSANSPNNIGNPFV